MTAIEDRLKLERKKGQVQAEIIGKAMKDLDTLSFRYKQKLMTMKLDSVGYKKLKEHKDKIDVILNNMREQYYDFKKELQDKRQKKLQLRD